MMTMMIGSQRELNISTLNARMSKESLWPIDVNISQTRFKWNVRDLNCRTC